MVDRVKKIMNYYNMSVNAFAQKIGANQVTMNQQMNGDRKISLDTVLKIINSFDLISPDWLLAGRGDMLRDDSHFSNSEDDLIVTNRNLSETIKSLSHTIENLTNK